MISTPAADTPRASPPAPTGVAFDDEGFLLEPADWTRALAERIAQQAGVGPLGERHWRVVELVRSRFFAIGALPVMRLVCRAAGWIRGRATRCSAAARRCGASPACRTPAPRRWPTCTE